MSSSSKGRNPGKSKATASSTVKKESLESESNIVPFTVIVLLVPLTLLLWRKMNWRPSSFGKRMATELSSWKKMVTEELEMLTARLEGPAEWKPELLTQFPQSTKKMGKL
ncbi:hypothetical protein ACLB2K_007335 [Fragaria x ananassa]